MSKPIDRLAEMVRQAEAKTRAQKLGSETHYAAEILKESEIKAREAEALHRERRVLLQRELAAVSEEEQHLRELTRKVAVLMGTATLSPADSQVFTSQIEETKIELEHRRRNTKDEIDRLNRDVIDTRRNLENAMEHYLALRRELDRLLPMLVPEFVESDKVARAAEILTPGGQVRALSREVEEGSPHFAQLDGRERLAQLTIWIGRFRRLQAYEAENLTEEETTTLQRVFPKLVSISKQYEPGYIEAFRQSFNTDWDVYVGEAEEQLRDAAEAVAQRRDEPRRGPLAGRGTEDRNRGVSRSEADHALGDLKAILIHYDLPEDEEGIEPFYEALDLVLEGRGESDPEVLKLIAPYRDLLTGAEFRSVRRHLNELRDEEEPVDPALQEQVRDLVDRTRDKRALMIGGTAREDVRTLEEIFEFECLDWESLGTNRPGLLDEIEERLRAREVDLVIILKALVGHSVTLRIRPACEHNEVPLVVVEKGYGPANVADALRKGMVRAS